MMSSENAIWLDLGYNSRMKSVKSDIDILLFLETLSHFVCLNLLLGIVLFLFNFIGKQLLSCWDGSINPTTLFLGRLGPTKWFSGIQCAFFRQQLTTTLLESAGRKEGPWKTFHG